MVQLPKPEQAVRDYLLPAEDQYTVVLDHLGEVTPSKFADKDGNFPLEQSFFFKIVDDEEFDGVELRVFVRMSWWDGSVGQPSKSYLIAKAMLGDQLDYDNPPDTDDLVGMRCKANVVHKSSVGTDGGTRTFANLTGWAPMRRRKQVVQEAEDIDSIPF